VGVGTNTFPETRLTCGYAVQLSNSGLSSSAVSHVVVAAGQRAGLERISADRLRHTAASQLLAAGAPLTEIGQLLRHRKAATTAIYAKVDRDALRRLARPWPGKGVA
jgi:integrase/recombinase XerD